jgi:hypothetical protein
VIFAVVGSIRNVEAVAAGTGIRILPYLRKAYGVGGTAASNGCLRWYEAHRIGNE